MERDWRKETTQRTRRPTTVVRGGFALASSSSTRLAWLYSDEPRVLLSLPANGSNQPPNPAAARVSWCKELLLIFRSLTSGGGG
ncbi:hypothetical protein HanPI659440_Chr07g0262211 [Helianthus annuus]|nr:hypothetical protein HanPI659440_Chr07g0262211 [Helianthus annuus]